MGNTHTERKKRQKANRRKRAEDSARLNAMSRWLDRKGVGSPDDRGILGDDESDDEWTQHMYDTIAAESFG